MPIMKRTAFFPNPSITLELMAVVVIATSALSASVLISTATTDNWYLDHINAFIAALMAGLSAHRLYLGVAARLARSAWIAMFVLFLAVAVLSPFEGTLDRIETAIGVEDIDDLCLWFVLPCVLIVALRSERIKALPFQLLLGGFAAQSISTILDLFDDNLAPLGRITIGELVDFSEFVYLQLYFVGLTLFMVSLYLKLWPAGATQPTGFSQSMAKRTASVARYQLWRLRNPTRTHGDFYAERITTRLDRGSGHATLGTQERARPAHARRGATGESLTLWERGTGSFAFLKQYGLSPTHKCVDYGCGSLRIGMHLIDHLAPGNYWGVDVTHRFFEDGVRLLDQDLVAEKQPRLDVISPDLLRQMQDWQPDWVFSVSVLMHVPPGEVEEFLRRITGLLAAGTHAVILFDRTERNAQTGTMSWTYNEAFLCEALRRIDPDFKISFRFFESAGYIGRRPISRLGMEISR